MYLQPYDCKRCSISVELTLKTDQIVLQFYSFILGVI